MFNYDCDAYMLQQDINTLSTGSRENILFSDDFASLKSTSIFSINTVQFYVEDGMLMVADNCGNIMPISEMLRLVSYLHNTIKNFDEKASIRNELLTKKKLLEDRLNNRNTKSKEITPKIGEVYLIRGENNRYKIGYSKNAKSRTDALRLSSCENHELIHKFKVKNPHLKEKELHVKYKDKRLHSEWFALNNEDIEYIKGLKNEL